CSRLRLADFIVSITPTPTQISTLSLHDALPISSRRRASPVPRRSETRGWSRAPTRPRPSPPGSRRPTPPTAAGHRAEWNPTNRRSEEHTSELQSLRHLVCRLLLEKKKTATNYGP